MQGQSNDFTKAAAKVLRHTTTDAEQLLWQRLRGEQLGVKFRQQHPYESYILDFVCLPKKLVVEVDGSQHVDAAEYDEQRTLFLNNAGFTVVRFWNNDVLVRTDVVVEAIWNALNPSPP